MAIPERHLGLHMPKDGDVPVDYIACLATLMETHADLDAVLDIAGQACIPAFERPQPAPTPGARMRIGVAQDAAFCFYYYE